MRAKVELQYEALSATGTVSGTSTASFEVAPFSNFEFRNSVLNSVDQSRWERSRLGARLTTATSSPGGAGTLGWAKVQ